MKILLTGGGTGGHFYPLIAIAEKLNEVADKEKIVGLKLYYMSDSPYDKTMLFEHGIEYVYIPAGKMRTYFSVRNFFDVFKTATGAFFGLLKMFAIYPDVVISKGGYAAFPAVFAAKLLRIPVVIHESDSAPGRLNMWTAKFAKRIATTYAEAAEVFPKDKTAWVGQPIRRSIKEKANKEDAYNFFKLEANVPTLLFIGGSSGAEKINEALLGTLPELLKDYQIIHQTGKKNIVDVTMRTPIILAKNPLKDRYKPVAYLNDISTKMAAGAATLIISRAGSAIYEIASWGVPSLIIPITNSNGDHQRKNAFTYARAGACEVIEEGNLTPHVLYAEIKKLLDHPERLMQMEGHAKTFASIDAGEKIAREAINIGLSHE